METVRKKAVDPDTEQECEIELPAPEVVRKAILKLDYPSDGIGLKEASDTLAEKFQLSDKQRNAENRHGDKVFYHDVVYPQFGNLLKKRKLDQPRGPKTPYVLAANTSLPTKSDLNPDIGAIPEKSIEKNYHKIREELTAELLQKIKDNTPIFFEELVIDLLVAMGYGGSREDAQAVGRSGDGGIDGIINEDRLGLDVIYVQAKRWEGNVGEPPVRDFVGALQGKRARKGIFITTSEFTNSARAYISAIDSRDSKVILIDGNQLAQLMIDHDVGVSIEKTYEIKRVDSDYFAENVENS